MTLNRTRMAQLAIAFLVALMMTAPLLLSEQARADSTVTFTSTADFNAGVKLDPGNEYFANNGVDTPTNWISYPNTVASGSKTFVAYQGDNDPSDLFYQVYAMSHDTTTGLWTGPVTVEVASASGTDGHGSPSMLRTASGRLLIFCCAHIQPIKVYRSGVADSVASWTPVADIAGQNTYPHPALIGSTVYVFFRDLLASGLWKFVTSTDEGTTWSAATTFIDFSAASTNVYIQGADTDGAKLWFQFVRVNNTVNNDMYVAYIDTNDNTVHCLPSFNGGVSLTRAEADANCLVASTGTAITFGGPIHVVGGNPYTIHQTGPSTGPIHLDFYRWTGSAWTSPVNITISSGDSIDFIPSATAMTAFVPVKHFSSTGDPGGGGGGDMQTWTSANNGVTWALSQTIMTQEHGGVARPLGRPVVPRGHNDAIQVIFSGRIFYSQPADVKYPADARLYAWGANGIVRNSANPSGTPSVETSTDDEAVTSGTFELASGRSDTFSTTDADGSTWKWGNTIRYDPATANPICTMTIAGGVANASLTSNSAQECAWSATFGITGDFDVHVKTSTPVGTFNSATGLCMVSVPYGCNSDYGLTTEPNGVRYDDFNEGYISAYTISGGVKTQVGTSTNLRTLDPLWLRITRAGNTFTWYRSTDGSSWTLDETTSFAAPTLLYPVISCYNSGAPDAICNFDNYFLASGSLSSAGLGGYARSGAWTSATQTYVSDVPNSITVGYTGASANGYIDSVAIVDSTGAVLWQDGTDKTAGTTATYAVAGSGLHKNWAVRVTLAGGGTASPTITDVAVNLGVDPACFATSSMGNTLTTILPIILLMAMLVAIVSFFLAWKGGGSTLSGLASGGLDPAGVSIGMVSVVIIILVFVAIVITGLNLTGSIC